MSTVSATLCPACGATISSSEPFCEYCGRVLHSLEDYPMQAARPTTVPAPLVPPTLTRSCPNCGHLLPTSMHGCPSCGRGITLVRQHFHTSGAVLGKRFYVLQHMGGGMSTLLLVQDRHQSNDQVLLKLAVDTASEHALNREYEILAHARHPVMPRALERIFLNGHVGIVLEYIPGSDLEQQLTHIDRQTGSLVVGWPYPQL